MKGFCKVYFYRALINEEFLERNIKTKMTFLPITFGKY